MAEPIPTSLPFHVIICPAAEEEKHEKLEEADSFEAVEELLGEPGLSSLSSHSFATEAERDAFIEGYEAGVGYLGVGAYWTNESTESTE
jgi:hypothetical protein